MEDESKNGQRLRKAATAQIKKRNQGPMAEVGRVVTVWVKYMGVIPDKIVFASRGAKP
jgi:hypothetical protein